MAIGLASKHAAAANTSPPGVTQRYLIAMKDCSVRFTAKPGGLTDVVTADRLSGSYHRPAPAGGRGSGLFFLLSCHAGNARLVCPELMRPYRQPGKSAARADRVTPVIHANPRYYTEAYVTTLAPSGTPISVDFCMGDDTRTVITEIGGITTTPGLAVDAHSPTVRARHAEALSELKTLLSSLRFAAKSKPDAHPTSRATAVDKKAQHRTKVSK